jgi:HlyD family secretion protein
MSGVKSAVVAMGTLFVGCFLMNSWVRAALAPVQPATTPATQPAATQPAEKTHVVKKGTLSLEIQTEGTLQPAEAFELRLKLKSYAAPLTIASIAAPWSPVKKGDSLLECETTEIKWAIEGAENALASARANLKKAEADAELSIKGEALAMRMQEDATKNAEANVKWFENMEGPQMLLQAELAVKNQKDSIEDQESELNQLNKMYKSEELTNATADIVIKRAIRSLDRSRIFLKMQTERSEKTKTNDYPIAKQRVLDGQEQARQALASLKIAQEASAVTRKGSLSAARIAVEQAEQKFSDMKNDLTFFSVKSPVDGVVVYGQLNEGMWQGGDPKSMKPGDKLASGQMVMRVFTPGKLKMDIGLSEMQAFWIEPGLKARITPAAFPLTSYEGACGAVVAGPKGNPGAFGYQLAIASINADPRVVPGMKATVHIEVANLKDVILVPVSTVADGKVSVKAKDGTFEKRSVVLGKSDGQQVEITSGLSVGDEVLLQAKK